MGRVALCRGVTFGAPQLFYENNRPTLEPEIDRLSNSLAVYVGGFVITAFFEAPNYQGDALVVTNPGSIQDLSHTPWGNWANRIRSVKIGPGVDALVADWRAGKASDRQIIVVDQLPDSVDDIEKLRT